MANSIYQEYIADRHHIHMKSTQWETLASFVQYLGRTGQAEIDETPRGWYVKYIDRDPKVSHVVILLVTGSDQIVDSCST